MIKMNITLAGPKMFGRSTLDDNGIHIRYHPSQTIIDWFVDTLGYSSVMETKYNISNKPYTVVVYLLFNDQIDETLFRLTFGHLL